MRFRFLSLPIILLCIIADVFGQDNLRNELFGEVNTLLAQAKEKKAELYAPRSFARAMDYLNEATDLYGRGKSLEDIREKIGNAKAYFAKALDGVKIGEVTLSATMAARTDAESAGAPKSSAELWKKAEAKFNTAAKELESGSLASAKSAGTEAETMYRTAELEAIKFNFLSPARELLKQADDIGVKDHAPKTLERARKLAQQVELLLTQKRYDTDEARQLAQEAKYEAAHAIYLHQTIQRMKESDQSYEDAIVLGEMEIQKVAGALGFAARFDRGYKYPVADAQEAIRQRENQTTLALDSLTRLNEVIRGKEGEIANLRQQVEAMERRLGSLTDAEMKLQEAGRELQKKLNTQREQEETIRQVSRLFTEEEGNVLRDGDNIIIRLYGLSFPVGKNTIEPQYYSLLTKVQDAIKRFPNCRVRIEGHTDSQGSDELNQTLSENRAKAVAEYFMANTGVSLGIDSQGYGESRPVASNDTEEGKAKNRRIDVVITPAWAVATGN